MKRKYIPVKQDDPVEVWRVRYNSAAYITDDLQESIREILDMEVGEKAEIRRIKMSKKKYDALPEFHGF